jgi:hypothetical protein
VPTVAGRRATIGHYVLDMPAPIVAEALGYHHNTTTKLAAQQAIPGADTPPAITHRYNH